jgi:lipid A ethanolaminephosphotransferase
VFSALGRHKYSDSKARSQEGLLDVIKHAGLDVLWVDNNSGCKGVCDRVRVEDVSQPVKGDPLCDSEECFDERLLRGLPELIRNARQDMVIVLHQKGSHGPAYWKRHPAAFKSFGPECETSDLSKCSQESIVAAYDNTIVYTDFVLAKAIDLLRNASKEDGIDTSLLYFSDHGESLGENNLYLHGAPYVISPKEQRHVPFMLWLSDSFRERFKLDQECLAARAKQEFSHDNIFHSTLGMLDINTAIYNPKLDLFSACSHGR